MIFPILGGVYQSPWEAISLFEMSHTVIEDAYVPVDRWTRSGLDFKCAVETKEVIADDVRKVGQLT